MEDKFTINICTKDRHTELFGLLLSLKNQTIKNWELVIVDGSQTPITTRQFIQQAVNELQHNGHKVIVAREKQRGVCHARNQAVEESKTEVICRIDDDSYCAPDYLEKLWNLMKKGADCAGGLVPAFGSPRLIRNSSLLNKVFNEIKFDKEGNLICVNCGFRGINIRAPAICEKCGESYIGDKAAMLHYPNVIKTSHHLRSSFMFRKSQWEKVGGYDTWTGFTGWREETLFCMKLHWAGYKKFITDTSAIAWHMNCSTGGVRTADYGTQLVAIEDKFREWAKLRYEVKGW